MKKVKEVSAKGNLVINNTLQFNTDLKRGFDIHLKNILSSFIDIDTEINGVDISIDLKDCIFNYKTGKFTKFKYNVSTNYKEKV